MTDYESDYVVVGSGAGGSVVAGRLAERPNTSVIVLEAGGEDSSLIYKVPGIGFLASFEQSSNWGFQTEPMAELGGRGLVLLQGRIVGGSSSINGMVYTRGHPSEYDLWRQMGCEGWAFRDVLPYFKRLEAREGGSDEWHGRDGPVTLKRSRGNSAITDMLAGAFARGGVPTVEDFDDGCVEGYGYFDANVRRGMRVSAATAYLRPQMKRGNARLLTEALATRVLFEEGRARAVEFRRDGRISLARARRGVILAGGAIKTPQLLMLSGIGPAGELARHGIDTLVDAPAVGANFQNHPSFRLEYAIDRPVTNYRFANPFHSALAGLNFILRRRGVLAETFVPAGGIIKSRPDLEFADTQFVVAAALIPKLKPGKHGLRAFMPQRDGFTFTLYQGTPSSRGRVGLRSADPSDAPIIEPGYLSDERDLEVLTDAIGRIRGMLATSDFAASLKELAPGPSVRSRQELSEAIRAGLGNSYHQSGTCAMGGEGAVTDPRLRVRGVEGLRIADASIIPALPNTALHGPVMMIGEKAADMIAGDDGLAR